MRSVYVDKQNNLWAGCWKGGVNYVNLDAIKSFKNLKHIPGKKKGLSGNMVTSICENSDNKLFITLDHSGLNVWDRKTGEIEYYFHEPGNRNSLASYSVTYLVEAKKDLFCIGFWGGFSVFDYSNRTIKSYYHDSNNSNSLPDNYYLFVLKTRDGRIILSSHEKKIYEFDLQNESFSNFTTFEKQCRVSAFQDSRGDIWFTDYLGVFKFNENGKFLEEFYSKEDTKSISNNWANVANEDKD